MLDKINLQRDIDVTYYNLFIHITTFWIVQNIKIMNKFHKVVGDCI